MSKSTGFLMCLVAAAFLAAACSGSEQPGTVGRQPDYSSDSLYSRYSFGRGEKKINIGVQPLALPEAMVSSLMARDRVLSAQLKAAGFELEFFPFKKGADINYFFNNGDLTGGFAGDLPTISEAASGNAVVLATAKQGFSSIVAKQTMLVSDLKGCRIATGLGSTAHFTLLSALKLVGIQEDQVKIVDVDLGDMSKALLEGRVDAFAAWEPTPSLALEAYPELKVIHTGINYGFFYLNRDFVLQHPKETRYLAASIYRAFETLRLKGNLEAASAVAREEAGAFLGRDFQAANGLVSSLTKANLLSVQGAPGIPVKLLSKDGLLAREFEYLHSTGRVPYSSTWEQVSSSFNTGIMAEIAADPKTYMADRKDYAPKALEIRR